jgi:hypothetical protein
MKLETLKPYFKLVSQKNQSRDNYALFYLSKLHNRKKKYFYMILFIF